MKLVRGGQQLFAGRGKAPIGGLAATLLAAITALALVTPAGAPAAAAKAPLRAGATPQHPNFVFVLTDDLSDNLLRYMPHVRQMRREGEAFSRYFVTNSLCCPSRASILTGRLPHNTGVFANSGPEGGFDLFHASGEESDTFATSISSIPGAHYETALMGKYLNGYRPSSLYVPPGWSTWAVGGDGYDGFNYNLNQNGRLVHYGTSRRDYLTDVLADRGVRFIRQATNAGHPFLLEISTFAPHFPFAPAPRDRQDFPDLRVPRTPAYNFPNLQPPTWLADRPRIDSEERAKLDYYFRKRAQSVESVDDLIGRLERTLRNRGIARDTYLVFSSDNGFHMGDHRLLKGKMTAFDTDIAVPLIVVGPGVPAGRTVQRLAANVDLRSTFSRLAGANVPNSVDGRSLVPLLHRKPLDGWRAATLVEHHQLKPDPSDPDHQPAAGGNPPSYEAIRGPRYTYVEYVDGEREYYDLSRDPFELNNTYLTLSASRQAQLHQTLTLLESCRGHDCR